MVRGPEIYTRSRLTEELYISRQILRKMLLCWMGHFQVPIILTFKTRVKLGAKKVSFTACHSGKQQLACTSPQVISTSPQTLFDQQDWLQSFCNLNFPKKQHLPWTKITSPIAKSTSPGLSDTTFFTRWPSVKPFWWKWFIFALE